MGVDVMLQYWWHKLGFAVFMLPVEVQHHLAVVYAVICLLFILNVHLFFLQLNIGIMVSRYVIAGITD